MGTTTLIGVYTYPNKFYLDLFKSYLEKNSPGTEFICIDKLPQGEYGLTHIEEYLKYLPTINTDKVILTDIRDVIIQRNLEEMSIGDLDFYSEYEKESIGNCPYNSFWMEHFFGEWALEKVKNERIINCSIIAGTPSKVYDYCSIWYDEMKKLNKYENGIDMATHNYLTHIKKYPATILSTLGPVYTCGYSPFILLSKHRIFNPAGELPFIVHQYDRHLVIT